MIVAYFINTKHLISIIFIGKVIPELVTKSGKIHFTFDGDECEPGINYKVDIIMKCDYSITGHSVPTIFEQASNFKYI